MVDIRKDFRPVFTELEMKAFDDFFNKAWLQIDKGMWGL
jgi:hypothetical protein